MTHTHHPGLLCVWKLRINRRHYIEVFVWQDKPSMYAAFDYISSFPVNSHMVKGHDFAARANAGPYFKTARAKTWNSGQKFGEIYVVKNKYSARISSHEIAHIVHYWAKARGWDVTGKDDEKAALLTGELNRQFWAAHYKEFENA